MVIIFKIHRTWINKRYITASRCPMHRWSICVARSTRLTAWNASCLLPLLLNVKQHLYLSAKPNKWKSCEDIDKATNTFINATLELESAIQQYQRAEAKLGGAVTTIGKKVDRYQEYDGCYLGHYAQWFFWFFFIIGFVMTFLVIFLSLKDLL